MNLFYLTRDYFFAFIVQFLYRMKFNKILQNYNYNTILLIVLSLFFISNFYYSVKYIRCENNDVVKDYLHRHHHNLTLSHNSLILMY